MRRFYIAIGIAAAAILATHGNAQGCETNEADKTAVAGTLRTFYAAAAVDDFARLHTVVAPTFYAFDGGTQYPSIDDLIQAVKAYQDKGVKFIWKVTDPKVTVNCNQAWISYVNDGSIQMSASAAPRPTKWLESAVLEKQNGAWKLLFFHSTQVPDASATH